jgi:prophage DNA circulation protein
MPDTLLTPGFANGPVTHSPAAPQFFRFGSLGLVGKMTSFTGSAKRRSHDHVFVMRDGGRVEDLGRAQFRLTARLEFLGPTAGADYEAFKAAIDATPAALLVHPIAGQWFAFCEGPDEDVDFQRASNEVRVSCTWKESELDGQLPSDTPDPATAAQAATSQQSQFQQSVAKFMGALAKLTTQEQAALNAIDSAVSQVGTVTAPVTFVHSAISIALGASSKILGALAAVQEASDTLVDDVTSFIAGANDLFSGDSDTAPAGFADSVQTLLGAVLVDAQALEDALIAASLTPAGAADAVADVVLMAENCLTLSDALAAAQPLVPYTVTARTNVVVLATLIIKEWNLQREPEEFAYAIMAQNRIPTPHAIPAGTQLLVPSR